MISETVERAINKFQDATTCYGSSATSHSAKFMTAARAALVQAIEAEVAAARGPSADERAGKAERQFAQDYLDDIIRTVKP